MLFSCIISIAYIRLYHQAISRVRNIRTHGGKGISGVGHPSARIIVVRRYYNAAEGGTTINFR